MYHPPPLRSRPALAGKKVLLIDSCQATREVRAAVLGTHAVEVHEAEEISRARFLWQPHVYDLVMLDVRRYSPAEALEFYEQISAGDPQQRIVFLVGPPGYLSRTWPDEVTVDEVSRGQFGRDGKVLSDGCLKRSPAQRLRNLKALKACDSLSIEVGMTPRVFSLITATLFTLTALLHVLRNKALVSPGS